MKTFFNNNMRNYMFMVTIFIIGFIYGGSVAYELKRTNALTIINDVDSLITKPQSDSQVQHFLNIFFDHFLYLFLIWILALTIVGILVVLFIVFFKGFVYGFVYCSMIYAYGLDGLGYSFLYTLLQNIFILPLLFYISNTCIKMTLTIFKTIYLGYNRKQLKQLINGYFNLLFFSVGVVLIYTFIYLIFEDAIFNQLNSIL